MNHYEPTCVDTSKTDITRETELLELLDKTKKVKTDYNPRPICKNCSARNGLIAEIEKVIFNNPATIVFWSDGKKTVVKCQDEEFDKEEGLAMAIAKRALGNKGNYYNEFRKWITKEEKE